MIPVRLADLSASDDTHRIFLLPTGGTTMSSTVTDNIYERPELLRLSDAAFRMHVRALAWAAAHGTAPEIPDYALPVVSPLSGGIDLIAELTGSGLWQPTEIDDLGYTLVGALPDDAEATRALKNAGVSTSGVRNGALRGALDLAGAGAREAPLAYQVEGTDSAVGFFPEIHVNTSNNQLKGTPFTDRVLDGIPRAHAIVAVAESLLRAHGRDGHHTLAIEVSLSTHPYLRAVGERASEWVGIAFAAGKLTADVPNWRGRGYAELTAFADGEACYPGWVATR